MFAFAIGGMRTAMVGSVGVGQPEISALMLGRTRRNIETTLTAEVGDAGCRGCCPYPPMRHHGSVTFRSATSGTQTETRGSVEAQGWAGNSVLGRTTGQRTIGTTRTVEGEAAAWLGN